jgi:hypothetical protein
LIPAASYNGFSGAAANSVRISLFAETSPNSGGGGFVTAYPLVVHKWQPESDPEVIEFPAPLLAESCLHPGQNILRSADVMNDWLSDNFALDFKLTVNLSDGSRKEFPLRKNIGLSGWEFSLTIGDLTSLSLSSTPLQAVITGRRGFNELRSRKFELPLQAPAEWEIESASRQNPSSNAKTTVTLKTQAGGCACLEAVILKRPGASARGEKAGAVVKTFAVNGKDNDLKISPDGATVTFEIDAAQIKPGPLEVELRYYSGSSSSLALDLTPAEPAAAATRESTAHPKASGFWETVTTILNDEGALAPDDGAQKATAAVISEAARQKKTKPGNLQLAETHNVRGGEYFQKGQYQQAFDEFRKAAMIDPLSAKYHYNLATSLLALKRFDEAEKEMLEATRIDPQNPVYRDGLEAARQNIKKDK